MKETCKGLLMLFIIIVIMAMMTGPVFAGPYKRTLTIFPHVHKTATIPENGAYIQWNEDRCFPYYYWEKLSCEEYFGLVTEDNGYSCSEETECDWKQKQQFYFKCPFSSGPGQGSEPPWLSNPDEYKSCFYVEENKACFQDSAKIQYEVPETEIEYEELVVQSKVGDEINLSVSLWYGGKNSEGPIAVTVANPPKFYSILVHLIPPTTQKPKLLKNLVDKRPIDLDKVNLDGVFKPDDVAYTFDHPGVHRFTFKIWKQDGTVGRVQAKVVVTEL